MKLIIASDIHGSALYLEKLLRYVDDEQPDRLLLLGDLLYHGPRNDLPLGHDPKKCIGLFNAYADRITSVRGNCDAEVDQMVLDFSCLDTSTTLYDENAQLLATHGHVYTPENHPRFSQGGKPWIFASGHTHVKVLEKRDGVIYLNPGSTSIPKDGSSSFASFDGRTLALHDLETGSVLAELTV